MTEEPPDERATTIDKLRDELHAYHVDVQKLVQRCEACRAEVVQLTTDIYGLPGNKETSPGLMGDVAELRRSRKLMLAGAAGGLGAVDDPVGRRGDGRAAGKLVSWHQSEGGWAATRDAGMQIRDRIKDFRRVKASQLRPHPKNWRTHPAAQQDALRGVLAEIGYAGALLARELPDGSLELIDGHLRAETTPDMEVPVLVLDLDEREAAKLLALHDPLAGMAEANEEVLADCSTRSRPRTTPCRRCSTRCWASPTRRRMSRRRKPAKTSPFPRRFRSSSSAATRPSSRPSSSDDRRRIHLQAADAVEADYGIQD